MTTKKKTINRAPTIFHCHDKTVAKADATFWSSSLNNMFKGLADAKRDPSAIQARSLQILYVAMIAQLTASMHSYYDAYFKELTSNGDNADVTASKAAASTIHNLCEKHVDLLYLQAKLATN